MDKNKRPCFGLDDKPFTVARESAHELLSLQKQKAKGAPFTPAVNLYLLFSIDLNADILAFLHGTHARLGQGTLYVNLDAGVAEMICKMYVAQCDAEMLDL